MERGTRRGWRTVVFTLTILPFVGYIGWIIYLGDPLTIRHVAYGLLLIVGLSVFGYIAENVTQRIRFKAGLNGVEGEIGND